MNRRQFVTGTAAVAGGAALLHKLDAQIQTREPDKPRETSAAANKNKPLLERIQKGEIDPSFVITHRMSLDEAPEGYDMFVNKEDDCLKVVLKP